MREICVPQELQPHLRPYQVVGFQWMASLAKNRLGAVLADDMGLGKTIQAITLLSHLKAQKLLVDAHGQDRPGLVVVPPGLINNWNRELTRWAPSLRVHVYHGQQRKLPQHMDEVDVVVTSYHIIRQDAHKKVILDLPTEPA